MDTAIARRGWQLAEPLHGLTYFAPETRAATDALGLRGFWMGYFGCRAAPLGAVPAAVVTAVFYNFNPAMVARAIPDAWGYASPGRLVEARLEAVDRAMVRVLGETVAGEDVRVAAALAADAAAAAAADSAGRPLAAANAALPLPEPPHLRLWQALTVLREHRGDGHVATLLTQGVGPVEAHVLVSAAGQAPGEVLRAARKWTEQDWAEATERLAARGWLAPDGSFTPAGRAAKAEIETGTDRLALRPYAELGPERVEDLFDRLYRLSDAVVSAGLPFPNPTGARWPPRDTV
jgi:hypothetical protein